MDTQFGVSNVLGGGVPIGQGAGGFVKLFELRAANLDITTDQVFTRVGSFTRYRVTQIEAISKSGAATLAAGGIYSEAAKGGTAIVAAAQAWSALSTLDRVLGLTLVALPSALQATPFLSLTVAAGVAGTADVLVFGVILD
ncbi:MAG: hypothetical protein V4857_14285 [Pseudomonadota bacterium]